MKLRYIVKDNRYLNIKQLLKEEFHVSERLITKLKKHQNIFLNNKCTFINHSLNIQDVVEIDLDFEEEYDNIVPAKMNLEILYEDDGLLIINKPPFVPVHPSMDHYTDSLSNGVKYYFDLNSIKRKIRPVNRLDKNTSGIVIFAKSEYIQEYLIREMKENLFKKEYLALIVGTLENRSGSINAPISRKENSIIERKVDFNGYESITNYEVINEYTNYSLVKFILLTGRTHQIRVHCKYIGHPILGDSLYGSASNLINRQALHAHKIEFIHPITKKNLNIEAKLPIDIKKLI